MPQNTPHSMTRKLVNTYSTTRKQLNTINSHGFRSIVSTAVGLASMFMCLTAIVTNTNGQEATIAAPKVANLTTEDRPRKTVTHLSETIGERNLTKPKKLDETVEYLQREFESIGYNITKQTFQVNGIDCHNLIAEVIGTDKPDEIVIVGAHDDSARGTPGANDNRSCGSGPSIYLNSRGFVVHFGFLPINARGQSMSNSYGVSQNGSTK
jgi:hypothetical protein